MTTKPKIKNYTSEVPPQRSIEAIEKLLIEAGVDHIGKLFAAGEVIGFIFTISVDSVPVQFRLPIKVAAVENLLTRGKFGRARDLAAQQAKRTAWRLLYDWVGVQLAMIRLGQADLMEIFLPYAYDAKANLTLYEAHGRGVLKQIGAPTEETP